MKKIHNYFKTHYSGNLIERLEMTDDSMIEINPFSNTALIIEKPEFRAKVTYKESESLEVILPKDFEDSPKVWRALIPEICRHVVKHFADHYRLNEIDVRYEKLGDNTLIFSCNKYED